MFFGRQSLWQAGRLDDRSFPQFFASQFSEEGKNPQVVYESKLYPPNLTNLLTELGISSKLKYESGIALSLDYLSDQYRKVDSPIFTFEEEKVP